MLYSLVTKLRKGYLIARSMSEFKLRALNSKSHKTIMFYSYDICCL